MSLNLLLDSLFPVLSGSLWYVGCYLILYFCHPLINVALHYFLECNADTAVRRGLLSILIIWFGLGTVFHNILFINNLIVFVSLYSLVYLYKSNLIHRFSTLRSNLLTFFFALSLHVLSVLALNYAGLHFEFLDGRLQQLNCLQNPILIIMGFTVFNGLRISIHKDFKIFRFMSGVLLLVYVLHENPVFRVIVRPFFISYFNIYPVGLLGFGCLILFAISLYLVCVAVAFLYVKTLGVFSRAVSLWLSKLLFSKA